MCGPACLLLNPTKGVPDHVQASARQGLHLASLTRETGQHFKLRQLFVQAPTLFLRTLMREQPPSEVQPQRLSVWECVGRVLCCRTRLGSCLKIKLSLAHFHISIAVMHAFMFVSVGTALFCRPPNMLSVNSVICATSGCTTPQHNTRTQQTCMYNATAAYPAGSSP